MIEVKEVLRAWLEGPGPARRRSGRGWTARPPAVTWRQLRAPGWTARPGSARSMMRCSGRWWPWSGRPARNGHGQACEQLLGREQQISDWVTGKGVDRPLTIVKIGELLARQGCVVPYRTLHRFATERCGYRPKETTVPVVDGEPGVECQIDFGQMGWLVDPDTERRRKVHALIFTRCNSFCITRDNQRTETNFAYAASPSRTSFIPSQNARHRWLPVILVRGAAGTQEDDNGWWTIVKSDEYAGGPRA